ncbi:hypothetical protein [uncultured Desulfosarcina sp.]|uniref:hypothetical protein n=1 Tax=uncultured Desulfosarcina sp. TaxID=218289 RepID=UPI00374A0729
MIIKTRGLAYDDRLQKEINTLTRHNFKIGVSCVEKSKYENNNIKGIESKTTIKRHLPLSRRMFSIRKGLKIKAIEIFLRMTFDVLLFRPKKVWVHDPDMIVVILPLILLRKTGYIKRLIWDLHELPIYIKRLLGKYLFRLCCKHVDELITTNQFRKDYLNQLLNPLIKDIRIIENYLRDEIVVEPKQNLPDRVTSWLSGRSYLLAQGGGRKDRYHDEIVNACIAFGIPLIIIGDTNKQIDNELIWYTGQIQQKDIYQYLDNCLGSVILYSTDKPNTLYCSPNRLYQAIGRGKPVLVGNNPPLKDFINKTGAGIVFETDGRNLKSLIKGISKFVLTHQIYESKAKEICSLYTWNSFESTLINLAGGILR